MTSTMSSQKRKYSPSSNDTEQVDEPAVKVVKTSETNSERKTENLRRNSSSVAGHYNELRNVNKQERKQSRIFYQRNFNNWIKSQLISDACDRVRNFFGRNTPLNVLDLASGRGGDLQKWRISGATHVVLTDIAENSVNISKDRYDQMCRRGPVFSAEFITADSTKNRLRDLYGKKDKQTFHISSCQFSLHYGFETQEKAEFMLRNLCESLRPGGLFIGTIPDANQIVQRLRKSRSMKFGNEIFSVIFNTTNNDNDDVTNDESGSGSMSSATQTKTCFPLFGCEYDFHLDERVNVPEYLVYFPLLQKLLEAHNMELIFRKNFGQFFNLQIQTTEGRNHIERSQGLETYPPYPGTSLSFPDSDYTEAAKIYEELTNEFQEKTDFDARSRDGERKFPNKIGTLSQSEWEVATLYQVFMFRKKSTDE